MTPHPRKHMDFDKLIEDLQHTLSNRKVLTINKPSARKAGVLMILYKQNGEPHLLFTQRTLTVANHKGQISFPGGSFDEHDEFVLETALRETWEEIGIKVDREQVLGALDDVYTYVSNFIVSPYIASAPNVEGTNLSEREIARLIEVPLHTLLDASNRRKGVRSINGVPRTIEYYACGDGEIWGLTAKILDQFLKVVREAYHTNMQ